MSVCEVEAAVVSEKLSSDELDAEPSSSWLPESRSSETVSETVSPTKVEAVTLMLTVQPGTTTLP